MKIIELDQGALDLITFCRSEANICPVCGNHKSIQKMICPDCFSRADREELLFEVKMEIASRNPRVWDILAPKKMGKFLKNKSPTSENPRKIFFETLFLFPIFMKIFFEWEEKEGPFENFNQALDSFLDSDFRLLKVNGTPLLKTISSTLLQN